MLRKVRDFEGDYLEGVRGANVYGPDSEKLGSIDDALIDDRTGEVRYFLIDSGLLSSHKYLLPADQVYALGDSDNLYANLRPRDLETLPEYRDDVLASAGVLRL